MTVAMSLDGSLFGTKSAVAPRHPRLHLFPSMDAEGVGDRLRRFRRLRGLTQEQLSELAGVRRDYIGNLERGAIGVPREPEQLKLLAKALGVTLRDLAQTTGWYDDEPSGPTDWERALAEDDRLSDDVKIALRTLIKRELERPETKESKKTA